MQSFPNYTNVSLELVKAGLWEKEVRLSPSDIIDFKEVLRIAEEQSVIGLLAAGLKNVVDFRVPQEDVLIIAGRALQIEQQNIAMNQFVVELFSKLQAENINALLIKGQGVAQCYEKPLWRTCGDVDLLLDAENYERAKQVLIPFASEMEEEIKDRQHLGMTIRQWMVELHGTLRIGIGRRIDGVIDKMQKDTFLDQKIRVWNNGSVEILLPDVNNDILFVFTHILQHYFRGGIGLRQICDWCRLLWIYRKEIDVALIEKKLRAMGLMSEWKTFSALAVNRLGMPSDAMPLFSFAKCWSWKADKILSFILETGNFGHNRNVTFYEDNSYLIRKTISFCINMKNSIRRFEIFPKDSIIIWCHLTLNSFGRVLNRE